MENRLQSRSGKRYRNKFIAAMFLTIITLMPRRVQKASVLDSCSLRLLVIAGEIIDSRTLAIFFFGSLKVLNLIVSSLRTYPAFNLEQKAEKTLIPFPRAL